jgi:hypothetical protein
MGDALAAQAPVFPDPPVTDHVWIQQNPDYTLRLPASSTHCCAQQHCRRLNPGQVIRAPEGGYIVLPSPPFIRQAQFFPEEEAYFTEADGEGEYWACVIGGKVRCLFVPALGF